MAAINCTSKSGEVSVYLLAENRLFRDTLARLLRKQTGICVVGVIGNPENIKEQIAESGCNMVLTDCSPGSAHSLLLYDLHEENSQIKILLVGMDDDPEMFLRSVYLGAGGYVLKEASASEIVAAVRAVARGEAVCPPMLCMTLMEHVSNEGRLNSQATHSARKGRTGLTHRQVQLMNLVAKGLTNKEIAANLNLSQFTVKNHIRRVMRQVEAASRYDAVDLIRARGDIRTRQ